MPDEITPALTPRQWQERSALANGCSVFFPSDSAPSIRNVVQAHGEPIVFDPRLIPALIALGNNALPDSHPLKITPALINAARWAGEIAISLARQVPAAIADDPSRSARYTREMHDRAAECRRLYDVLEAYLPPAAVTDDG